MEKSIDTFAMRWPILRPSYCAVLPSSQGQGDFPRGIDAQVRDVGL